MTTFAQLSDPHVSSGDLRGIRRLRAVAEHLEQMSGLSAVLVTGDVTQSGTREELALFDELAPQGLPLILLPGNHDARGPAGEDPRMRPAAIAMGEAVLVTLDSTLPGWDDGALGEGVLAGIDELLATVDRPTLLALHHPPARLRMKADSWPLHDAAGLGEIVARHRHVVGVLAGHAHATAVGMLAGRPVFCCPSLQSASLLPEEGEGLLHHDPPAFAVHHVDEDGLVTHVRTVPEPRG